MGVKAPIHSCRDCPCILLKTLFLSLHSFLSFSCFLHPTSISFITLSKATPKSYSIPIPIPFVTIFSWPTNILPMHILFSPYFPLALVPCSYLYSPHPFLSSCLSLFFTYSFLSLPPPSYLIFLVQYFLNLHPFLLLTYFIPYPIIPLLTHPILLFAPRPDCCARWCWLGQWTTWLAGWMTVTSRLLRTRSSGSMHTGGSYLSAGQVRINLSLSFPADYNKGKVNLGICLGSA